MAPWLGPFAVLTEDLHSVRPTQGLTTIHQHTHGVYIYVQAKTEKISKSFQKELFNPQGNFKEVKLNLKVAQTQVFT